jgi:hypothetical protein
VVGSSSATYFIIDNGGRVGIGTSSPQYALDVNGDINVASGKCFRVNGVCIGYVTKLAAIYATSSAGTTTVSFTGAPNSGANFSGTTLTIQNNISHYIVEGWGAGGGGGAQTNTTAGTAGTQTCFSQGSIACGSGAAEILRAGGGTQGTNGGAGGAGGTATRGVFNINGAAGAAGGASAPGIGGSAPHGGGAGGAPGASAATGAIGQSFGGGGGAGHTTTTYGGGGGSGAYSMNIASTSVTTASTFTVGQGGTGGVGTVSGGVGGAGGVVITVYATSSPSVTGNDYAEMFPVSNPGIQAGDIVSVDAGTPISMKLALSGDTAPLAGIVSTYPGQTLGDQNIAGMRPIALSGRVPTNVNLEGGVIQVGDRIALSSIPGVGKKASMFEDSVGIAIDNYDGSQEDSKVMVFVNLQRGVDVNAIAFSLLGNDNAIFGTSSATSTGNTPLDFVGGMMSAIGKRIALFTFGSTAATSSATTTDALASSTPSTVDGFAQSLLQSIFNKLTQILSTAGNGIGSIFANALHAKEEICVDDQCLSKDDIKAMKARMTQAQSAASAGAQPSPSTTSSSSHGAVIQIQGNNPATIQVGDVYADLGAVITGPAEDTNLGIDTLVDGLKSDTVTIDTSFPAEHVVTYRVIDKAGYVSEVERTVRVSSSIDAGGTATSSVDAASTTPETTSGAVSTSTISTSDASSTTPTI